MRAYQQKHALHMQLDSIISDFFTAVSGVNCLVCSTMSAQCYVAQHTGQGAVQVQLAYSGPQGPGDFRMAYMSGKTRKGRTMSDPLLRSACFSHQPLGFSHSHEIWVPLGTLRSSPHIVLFIYINMYSYKAASCYHYVSRHLL